MFQIERICIDLDGVLNKFSQHVLRHLGFDGYDDTKYPTRAGWEIQDAANVLAGYNKYPTKQSFWGLITRDVWASAPKSDEFDLIMNHSERLVGRENMIILTAPTIDPDCMAGKLEWMQANLPRWMQRQFLVGPQKQFCARPGTLLIDDADKNIDKFKAAGGMGLLVPRPWNTNAKLLSPDVPDATRYYLMGFFEQLLLCKGLMNGRTSIELPSARVSSDGLPGDGHQSLHNQMLAV